MNYLENDTNENNNENNNDKQYSDKDIQVSTQLAYMDFDQKEVERYQHEVGDDTAYPTVQWMLMVLCQDLVQIKMGDFSS